jgi:hypothetical protein
MAQCRSPTRRRRVSQRTDRPCRAAYVRHEDVNVNVNVACLHGPFIGSGLALDRVHVFLDASLSNAPCQPRRVGRPRAFEYQNP